MVVAKNIRATTVHLTLVIFFLTLDSFMA